MNDLYGEVHSHVKHTCEKLRRNEKKILTVILRVKSDVIEIIWNEANTLTSLKWHMINFHCR